MSGKRPKQNRLTESAHLPTTRRDAVVTPRLIARVWSSAVIALAVMLAPLIGSADTRRVQPNAVRQIQALQRGKAARNKAERKIQSRLLLAVKRQHGAAIFSAVPTLRTTVPVDRDGGVLVDISGDVGDALLAAIEAEGGDVDDSHPRYRAVRARLPLAAVAALAARPDVTNIRPADRATTNKVDTSEGDVTHAADTARTTFSVDGTGVRIGVLSDSVDALADLQTSGDLPGTVTVLPGQSGVPGSSEGTAMLEIVHDLAPGAELYFATAFGSMAGFAQNILDLQAAGCQVIVDDVFHFSEGVFQDGIVAQAVDTVAAAGVQYYSSAGNSGNLNDSTAGVWESDFVATTSPEVVGGLDDAADFGGGNPTNEITFDSPSIFILQWSDPLGSSANDYDLYLLDPTLTDVLDASEDLQTGFEDPIESIDSTDFDDTGNMLVILKWEGQDRMLHLNANRGMLAVATAGQTAGHATARGAFGVAAVNWFKTQVGTWPPSNPGPFTGLEPVETFSSDGPRRIHFEADGTAITPGDFSSSGGELRQKPDISAADGVSTATPGFNPFFGTSAAAPHAAPIGALMLSLNSSLTPADVRTIFEDTAIEIEASGSDRDSGSGLVMADEALAAAAALAEIFSYGFESGNTSAWSSSVGGL